MNYEYHIRTCMYNISVVEFKLIESYLSLKETEQNMLTVHAKLKTTLITDAPL